LLDFVVDFFDVLGHG